MKKGFTLIELLVVSSIIIFFSLIIIANYRTGEEGFRLQRAAYKLAQDIRRAEEMAMSTREFGYKTPKGGYGIYLNTSNSNSYILYADENGNERYDSASSDFEVEKIYLEKGVFINSLSPGGSISINFKPPQPQVKINGNLSGTASITLALESDSAKTKTIEVNSVGLIEVK